MPDDAVDMVMTPTGRIVHKDLALVTNSLDLVMELWPVGGVQKTLTDDQWNRLRRILLSVPNLVDQ